ncbi:MAG: hypothetical protein KF716_23435 [Anaerolineae bacterium]|nr:hypothetical protein [Anaerolineae bacterium]
MDYQSVSQAVEKGGSIREAAKLLKKSYTAVQWWLARNGYKVVKKASLVPIHADQTKGE